MADIALQWIRDQSRGDFALVGAGLVVGSELETAMLISLFTDRTAATDDAIPDGTTDPRGWWADGDVPIGSRLWLLDRAKATNDTLQKAYDWVAEGLQWLIDDGVVQRFDIGVRWVRQGFLGIELVTYQPSGVSRFSWVWSALAGVVTPARIGLNSDGLLLDDGGVPLLTDGGAPLRT